MSDNYYYFLDTANFGCIIVLPVYFKTDRILKMKRLFIAVFFMIEIGLVFPSAAHGQSGENRPSDFVFRLRSIPDDYALRQSAVDDLTALCSSYPDLCLDIAFDQGRLYLKAADGSFILYDDGLNKTFEQKLASPDIEDMFSMVYPIGAMEVPIDPNFDPGRIRAYPVFEALYGHVAADIRSRLVKRKFCGQTVTFNGSEGASTALEAVSRELDGLLIKKPHLKKYILPLGGSFNYRKIAGTRRLSAHSYGIAIDLNPQEGAYWRSSSKWQPSELRRLRREYPKDIVNIFESQRFIWGGKWGHYDLAHFEFRPEIIMKAEMLSQRQREQP